MAHMAHASLCKRESLEKGEREMTFVIRSLSQCYKALCPGEVLPEEAEIKVNAVCGTFRNINCLWLRQPIGIDGVVLIAFAKFLWLNGLLTPPAFLSRPAKTPPNVSVP